MPPTSDIRVASPAPVLDGPRAFARALVGKSRQDQFHRRSVTRDEFPDPDAFHRQGPFRIDGEISHGRFHVVGHRLGVRALRAASDLLSHPRARWFSPTQAWMRAPRCCQRDFTPHRAKPASPSAPPSLQFLGKRRIQRLGLGPRSRLRQPFDRPGLRTGESASMGPTVIACRLLQLQTRRTSTTASDGPCTVTKAATLFAFCTRGVFSACGGEPTGRRPRTLKWPPQRRFPPLRLGDADTTASSTSTASCDAGYRWPWFNGPEDRVKDPRSLDGCADSPPQRLLSTPRHRCSAQ
jgi:hypothetical protein